MPRTTRRALLRSALFVSGTLLVGCAPAAPSAAPTSPSAAKPPASTPAPGAAAAPPAAATQAQAAPAAAASKPRTVAEVALYRGPDRAQVLEAGARAEGALLIYATGTQIQPLLDTFMKAHPYVKVELFRGGSDEIARRTVEEAKAGRLRADAFELSIAGLLVPRDEKVLQPYYSPELAQYQGDARDSQGHWAVVRESYIGLGWNTSLVDSAQAPRSYQDLLDPRWQGRMAISGSPSTAAQWVGTMAITHGVNFVRQFAQQKVAVHDITSRALADLMIAGEVAMSPTTYNSHVSASREKGAPLAWRATEPVPVTDTAYALAATAPHPHAAMLMADFLLSRAGQEQYVRLGYDSARSDLTPSGGGPKKVYLSARPNFVDEYEDWVRLFQDVFLKSA